MTNKIAIHRDGNRYTKYIGYKDAVAHIEQLKSEGYFNDEYPVTTPISITKGIIFNDNKQVLRGYEGLWLVNSIIPPQSSFINFADNFVWVACKRDKLEVGDVAYRTNILDYDFTDISSSCIILNSQECVHVSYTDDSICISKLYKKYWYKLVEKKD